MSLPGGIRTKLALALVAIVGGSLLAAYLIVVPQLENRLVNAKLDQLEQVAGPVGLSLPDNQYIWPDWVENPAAVVTNSRVVVFETLASNPTALVNVADSRYVLSSDADSDPVAVAAARSGEIERDRVDRRRGSFAEVAVPLPTGQVVLFSASLADALATVRVVQRRLLAAMVAAPAIALFLGAIAAAMHARRIRRLERAANRIAEGHFDEPVADDGEDELGELAQAFDRMRVQLSQLDTARKEFVANASHELRTPLFALAGFLELLADEELDAETRRDFVATMRGQVDRLTKLATDLLDLSRIDAGRLRIEREDVDLAEIARTLVEELRALAEGSGHRLTAESIEDVWAAGDEERVLQIGRALAGNALLHTPPGTRVGIRVSRDAERAWLEVADNGPGIPAEHLRRVFDRFYRVEGGQASGSGLGLAIAGELAGRMGGEVRVESRPGWTVFTLDLPGAPATDRSPELVRV